MFDLVPNTLGTLLKNQPNFRDLGGIPAADGRKIKPGILYRSGDLSNITPADIRKMEDLGIRMIIDFRSDREIIQYPTPLIRTVKETKRIIIPDSSRHLAEKMLKERDAVGLATLLVKDYQRVLNDHADDFREFFRILQTTRHLPLVYHCMAGKDRTGLATFFLLRSLGVSDTIAREDFLSSNYYLKAVADRVVENLTKTGDDGEILRPLMEVRNEYLDAALQQIDEKFESLEQFLRITLLADKKILQRRYLEY